MSPRARSWLRPLAIVAAGIAFLVVSTVIVYAIQIPSTPPNGGQTRAGDHNWRDVEAEGNALCQSCHFLEHNAHGPNNTCLDCHAPDPGDHAARVVTCQTCHTMHGGGGFTTQDAPLPDPTTTAPPTTSSTTSSTAAPTTTTSSTTTTTAAPTTTTSSTTSTTTTTTAP